MKKIEKIFSLHLNSNKPEKFEQFSESFFKNISNPGHLEIIVHIDKDDMSMKSIINTLNSKYNNSIKYVETDLIKNFNDAWKPINLLLDKTNSSVKIVACLSDDIRISTKNWDLYFLKHLLKYQKDEIFRIRCSQYKHQTYSNLWECCYRPDFSFYSKKWLDTVGCWNPCIGPDTYQEIVSYYLNLYGEDYYRSVIDENVVFEGEETLTDLSLKERIKRTKLGYKSFSELLSYKIQKKSFEAAYSLAKEISNKEVKLIKVNYLTHTIKNFLKKLKFFHHRGSKSWLTSSILFNIVFLIWCRIDFFDKYIIYTIKFIDRKNILEKIITNKEQYKKLKEAIKSEQ